jgi:hypothetical protein
MSIALLQRVPHAIDKRHQHVQAGLQHTLKPSRRSTRGALLGNDDDGLAAMTMNKKMTTIPTMASGSINGLLQERCSVAFDAGHAQAPRDANLRVLVRGPRGAAQFDWLMARARCPLPQYRFRRPARLTTVPGDQVETFSGPPAKQDSCRAKSLQQQEVTTARPATPRSETHRTTARRSEKMT